MKPINEHTALQSIAGWVGDFHKDHGRYPVSLEDLAENKNPKHDYDPARALERLSGQGFNVSYSFDKTAAPALKVQKNDDLWVCNIASGEICKCNGKERV
jgi:hypothetical protein